MMMQMLHAGGVPVVADTVKRDEFNPWGYFEIPIDGVPGVGPGVEPLLRHCVGRAMKVTAASLPLIRPHVVELRVIYMVRDVDRVTASFGRLNAARGSPAAPSSLVQSVSAAGMDHAARLAGPDGVLVVQYEDAVRFPRLAAEAVASFVGLDFDVERAALVPYSSRVERTIDSGATMSSLPCC